MHLAALRMKRQSHNQQQNQTDERKKRPTNKAARTKFRMCHGEKAFLMKF
jgi:hypothetical protein